MTGFCSSPSAKTFMGLLAVIGHIPSTVLAQAGPSPKPIMHVHPGSVTLEQQQDLDRAPQGMSVSCRVPETVTGVEFFKMYRRAGYGPLRNISVLLAEVNFTQKWDNPDVTHLPGAFVTGDKQQKSITFTIQQVTCFDAGNYSCFMSYLLESRVYGQSATTVQFEVRVKPGRIRTSGRGLRLVLVTGVRRNLTCVGSVGTLSDGEQVTWIWEFKSNRPNTLWRNVTGRRQLVSSVPKHCYIIQTSILTLQPKSGDTNGTYKCYIMKSSTSYHKFAGLLIVDISPDKASGSGRSTSVMLWIIGGGAVLAVFTMAVIFLLVLVYQSRHLRKAIQKEKSDASRHRAVSRHLEEDTSSDLFRPADEGSGKRSSPRGSRSWRNPFARFGHVALRWDDTDSRQSGKGRELEHEDKSPGSDVSRSSRTTRSTDEGGRDQFQAVCCQF